MAKQNGATTLSPKDVARFKRDARTYTDKVTLSRAAARAALAAIGTHTRNGKLAKPYK